MTRPSRRAFVAGLPVAAAWAMLPRGAYAQEEAPLKARATRKGLVFGAAVQKSQLLKDRRFAEAVIGECAMLVPEWEMKWGAIERRRDERR